MNNVWTYIGSVVFAFLSCSQPDCAGLPEPCGIWHLDSLVESGDPVQIVEPDDTEIVYDGSLYPLIMGADGNHEKFSEWYEERGDTFVTRLLLDATLFACVESVTTDRMVIKMWSDENADTTRFYHHR